MATVTITLTDVGDEGDVTCALHFEGKFDPDSEAHELAMDLAADLAFKCIDLRPKALETETIFNNDCRFHDVCRQ